MRDHSLKALEHKFRDYFAIAEAVAILLYPHAEVVLHDIPSGRIVRIWNCFSSRKAGDPSHLEGASDLFTEDRLLGPYEKALPSEGRTKSMTAALYDADDKITGFFCVNLDITVLDNTVAQLLAFTSPQSGRAPPIYLNDLQQQISYIVQDFLLSASKTLDSLTRAERVSLIGEIEANGLFQARNAIKFVAKALNISRASVYNLLADSKVRTDAGPPTAVIVGGMGNSREVAARRSRTPPKP